MSEFSTGPNEEERNFRTPESITQDPTVRREINRDIISEKQQALDRQIVALDNQIQQLVAASIELDQRYPENALADDELQQHWEHLETKRQMIGPDHPNFEETVATHDRVKELIAQRKGEDLEYPTAVTNNTERMVKLQEEMDILTAHWQALERRRIGDAETAKEALLYDLYPTPGSERN